MGGQALEKWRRQLFVDSDRAVEALDFFLKTGKQAEHSTGSELTRFLARSCGKRERVARCGKEAANVTAPGRPQLRLLSGLKQAGDVVAASRRKTTVKGHKLSAVAPSQSEEVSVCQLFTALRHPDFRHHCRRQCVRPELMCPPIRREDEELIGRPLRRPRAPGSWAQTRMTPSSVTAQVAQPSLRSPVYQVKAAS